MSSQDQVYPMYVSLLGGFRIRMGEMRLEPDDIPGRKAPALLKLLALDRDHQLVRDQAIDLLWADLEATKGAAQLYKAVHQLRKVFGALANGGEAGDWIDSARNIIRLSPPGGVVTDVVEFENTSRQALASGRLAELKQSAALYAGELLPMDLYAGWAETPREHLRQVYIDVLLAMASVLREQGDLAAAAETFRAALERDPVLEAAHRGLMQVFAQQGQRERALKQYGTCLDVLAGELGVAPSKETRALYGEIEAQHPEAVVSIGRAPAHSPIDLAPLVNRKAECRVIDHCLAMLVGGQGCVMTIAGAAGIGKTRLRQELVSRAQARGFEALVGSSYEMEGVVAYGPFIEILQAALRNSPASRELIPAEIAAALPDAIADAQPVPNSDRRAAQTYLFAGIEAFFRRRAASGPLVVVLENAHIADQGSLALWHFLARRLRDVPMLLVATLRSDGPETGEFSTTRMRELSAAVETHVLDLGPLAPDDHHELLRQRSGRGSLPRARADEVFKLSEGNPMYALELHDYRGGQATGSAATDGPGEGTIPPSLRLSVAERLKGLSTPARELLTLASVWGEGLPYPFLKTLWSDRGADAAGGEPGLLDLIDQLTAARLLDERGIQYHFLHALYRSCVYESASGARRRELHARVARALVQAGEREDDLAVEQIAFHYARAGDARQAAHFLTIAGGRAAAMYAHEDALSRYREALELLEPAVDAMVRRICGNLYQLIGDTNRAAGYLGEAFAAYEQAMTLIRDLPVNGVELTALHGKLALVSIFNTDMPKAGQHLAEAWGTVGDDSREHAKLHILRALYLWHFNRLEEAAEYANRALQLAEVARAPLETAQACEILAMAYLPLGRWQEGLHYERRRLREGRWSPDLVVATDAHLCLWEYHINDDNMLDRASTFMQEVSEEADRLGDVRCVAICQYALGTIHLWQGETGEALNQLDESLSLHDKVGSPAGVAYALARRAVLHTLQNAIDLGWESVQRGIEQAGRAAIRDHCLQRLYGVGIWNRLQAGDAEQVAAMVTQSESLLAASGPCTACSLDLYPWLALYYLEQGEIDRVSDYADSLETLSSKTGNPVGEAFAAIVRCGAEQARGNTDRYAEARRLAEERMRTAVSRGHASPMTWLFDRMAAPA